MATEGTCRVPREKREYFDRVGASSTRKVGCRKRGLRPQSNGGGFSYFQHVGKSKSQE